MNPEELKAKIVRLYDELNRNNMDVLREIMDPHFVAHGETMMLEHTDSDHLSAVARGIQMAKQAFPDLYVSVDDVVAEGDKAVARLTWRGTLAQGFPGADATGKPIEWTGIAINRFENGKIVERWFNSDELGMMRSMGMLPTPGQQQAAPAGQQAPAQQAAPAAPQQTHMPVASPTGAQVTDEQLERNKQIVRDFYEHVFTEGHVEHLKDIMVEEFTDHGEALFGSPHGRNLLEGGIAYMRQMFPKKNVAIEDMIAEGDMVGVRGVMTMVHSAPWLGKEPTGNELVWNGLSIFRIKDGKIVDRYFNSDSLYILEQLGYWPVKK